MTLINIVTGQPVAPGVLGVPAARTTVLTGMTQAQLQAALASAQAALVAWVPGGKVVTASYGQGDGTKSVTYNMTSMSQLMGWIMLLQQALGIGGRRRPLVPIYF